MRPRGAKVLAHLRLATVCRATRDARGDQMPLNPEEVVNKRFSPTKFRQGYDEEEVDEFLDEVVAELRRLNAENDELRSKLSACESRVSQLSRGGSQPAEQGEHTEQTDGTPQPQEVAASATAPAAPAAPV